MEDVRQLVDRAQHHDGEAWAALYRHAQPRLQAYARSRLATPEAADDAVSETMARALQGIARFTWTGAGVDGWLFGILRNVVYESYRRAAREELGVTADERAGVDDDPLHRLLAEEDALHVRMAFGQLRAEDRRILELRVLTALDAEATGAVLGKRAGAVRMAQSRALGRLRILLEPPD